MTKLTPAQKEMLKSLQYKRLNFSRDNLVATSLVADGLIFRSWYEYDYSEYAITPAGLAYLYQDAPMVDQPQPAPEAEGFKVGDFVDYVDVNNRVQRGQIFNISPYGKLYIVSSTGNRHIERRPSNVQRVSE